MNTPTTGAAYRCPVINASVFRDFLALASHMNDCQRSHGRFFVVQALLESLQALASPRIVTTGTLVAVCSIGLWAFA
ncbi:MAG: hypothetical protein Q8R56_05665 [Polaromonas sp.]|jgi:hypothetical protein|nr:hypothetical protein [Polaromonas sp.]